MLNSVRFPYRFPRALSFVLVPLLLLLAAPLTGQPVQVTHAATIEVTNGNDSGPGSLRDAIEDANTNGEADTITFAPDLTTVTLTDGQLTISADLTIDGGAGVTVERSNEGGTLNFRIFQITGGDVTLDNLTIRNGNAPGNAASVGGGIYNNDNDGTLTVTNSTISGNEANNGGGILNNGGVVTVENSTISGNEATFGFGGGINNNDGTLMVTNSTISGNESGNGGGIANYNGGVVMVENSIISGNMTGGSRRGGGIANAGVGSAVTVENSTISDNMAEFGGGIANAGFGSAVTVTNSTINGNESGNEGGGIHNDDGDVTVENSTISDNTSTTGSGGGGIFNTGGEVIVTNSTLSGNESATFGGGINNTRVGTLTVENSTISDNMARNNGGGIHGTVTVTNSTISGNESGRNGGGIYGEVTVTNSTISGNESDRNGGGIYNLPGTTLTLANTIVANSPSGGDVYNIGILTAEGNNIISDTSISDTNITNGTDPQLGLLQDNGGPTLTHLPQPGSPAIDAGDNAEANDPDGAPLTIDQRGLERIVGSSVDIGAVEVVTGGGGDDATLFLPLVNR
jgi:hypothetical protein